MWCVGRRSKKIKKELMNCQDIVIAAIKEWLLNAYFSESEALSGTLLGITDGMAFEPIDHPEKLNDEDTWILFRKMILAVLKG
jgi:hypothetical protein